MIVNYEVMSGQVVFENTESLSLVALVDDTWWTETGNLTLTLITDCISTGGCQVLILSALHCAPLQYFRNEY